MLKTSNFQVIERMTTQVVPWYSKRLMREHIMRYEFASHHVKDRVVIDVACGTGFGSFLLANSGAKHIYAIDIDKDSINLAKKNYPHEKITFIHGDAQNVKLKTTIADIVISFETIEHLQHPKKFVKEINRLLKPNGLLILSTPNKDSSYEDNPYHLKEYSYTELASELSLFKHITFYGQRPVYKNIVFIYKKIFIQIKSISYFSIIKLFLRFRPWEGLNIIPIKNQSDTAYVYFLAVCKKS